MSKNSSHKIVLFQLFAGTAPDTVSIDSPLVFATSGWALPREQSQPAVWIVLNTILISCGSIRTTNLVTAKLLLEPSPGNMVEKQI